MDSIQLKKIRKSLRLTQEDFAKKIGVVRQTIIQYENGAPIPPTKAELIEKLLENVTNLTDRIADNVSIDSEVTILEREGQIKKSPKGRFPKHKTADGGLVPYYDVDFAAGNDLILVDNEKVDPDYYMDIPEFAGCTAFRAYSDSMERLIKSGSILFGTKVNEWMSHLEYGQIYGIICTDGRRYLKYIRRFMNDPQQYYLLKSENDNYDDFEMPKNSIRSIWLIHGWLHKRT